jgi:hypothetical protein
LGITSFNSLNMLEQFGTNPTQLVGILSFAAATITCLVAGRRAELRDARAWKMLAFINLLFLLEIFVGLRHRIFGFAATILTADETDDIRFIHQILALSFLAIASILATIIFFCCRASSRPTWAAIAITFATSALFAIETVSLRSMYATLYRLIGPVMVVGWIWALASIGIAVAAVRVSSRHLMAEGENDGGYNHQ